jgi:hypothetical protein
MVYNGMQLSISPKLQGLDQAQWWMIRSVLSVLTGQFHSSFSSRSRGLSHLSQCPTILHDPWCNRPFPAQRFEGTGAAPTGPRAAARASIPCLLIFPALLKSWQQFRESFSQPVLRFYNFIDKIRVIEFNGS